MEEIERNGEGERLLQLVVIGQKWKEREKGKHVTVCCRLYLLMPHDEEEQKGFPTNREFCCSWDDVLVSTATGFCSGI